MKKFNFSLQKVLDFREFEKKQAEAELGKAVAEETKIQNTLDMIAKQHASSVVAADSMKDINDMLYVQNYFRLLDYQKEQALTALAQAQVITEEKRDVMRNAMKNCKVLENLRDSRKDAWKKENIKAEENTIDDIVTSKYSKNQ
ncbi:MULTISPECIES: flagellar export protein FliJ [unclassified Treponema]|uniref:flagellar export protein FliJ n=1 Tax=unclassified Treponema TaxID=2638727 RepID=UPI0025FB098D|nr:MULTISPECIES: flagellar export protein FliJ [unclassified Treponema]MBQ8679871.1 flagellar export protein FliJ [Treponema sp.]